MSTVFIVQERMKREGDDLVPVIDFSPAAEYGDPEVLLPSDFQAYTTGPMMKILKRKLRGFSDEDYLLGAGDTVAMMAAAMVASDRNRGRVNMLRWDRTLRRYVKTTIDMETM